MKRRIHIVLMVVCVFFIACACRVQSSKTITIHFELNNGQSIDPISYTGSVIDLPINFTFEGHDFAGWFTDSECSQPFNADAAFDGMTLYAGWTLKEYTVTYFLLYGEAISQTFLYGDLITLPKISEVEGKNFDGWFLDSNYHIPFEDGLVAASNLALFGRWVDKPYHVLKIIDWDGSELFIGSIEDGKRLSDYLPDLPLLSSLSGFYNYYVNGQKIDPLAHFITEETLLNIVYNYPISSMDNFNFLKVQGGYSISAKGKLKGEIFLPPTFNGELIISTKSASSPYEQAAFYGDEITSVFFPLSYLKIGAYSFYGCSSLFNIGFAGSKEDGDSTHMDGTAGSLVIGEYAFYNCALVSLSLPEGITFIEDKAFSYNYELRSVSLPASLAAFGAGIFEYCVSLSVILVSDDSTFFTSNNGNLLSKDGKTFYYYTLGNKSVSFSLPLMVETIAPYAFATALFLKTIELYTSRTLKGIEDFAFAGCENLAYIEIPDTVNYIGNSAFLRCFSLKNAVISTVSELNSIGAFAFSECVSLESFYLPQHARLAVGDEARVFYMCVSLAAITASGSNKYYYAMGGVVYDSEVETLLIYPAGRLGSSYQMEESTLRIGQFAFYGSANLFEVELSWGLEGIGTYAFAYSSLVRVTLPASLKRIDAFAFSYCYELMTVEFSAGSMIESIGLGSFYGCALLETFIITAAIPPSGDGGVINIFSALHSLTIYVEPEHLEKYKQAWKPYLDMIEAL